MPAMSDGLSDGLTRVALVLEAVPVGLLMMLFVEQSWPRLGAEGVPGQAHRNAV